MKRLVKLKKLPIYIMQSEIERKKKKDWNKMHKASVGCGATSSGIINR